MIKIGLTGSIGMGKSTVLSMFAELGAATWDADAAVHRLYAKDGQAVGPIGNAFQGVVSDGAIDRAMLAKQVLNDPLALQLLEEIVHPLVGEDREAFMTAAAHSGAKAAVAARHERRKVQSDIVVADARRGKTSEGGLYNRYGPAVRENPGRGESGLRGDYPARHNPLN